MDQRKTLARVSALEIEGLRWFNGLPDFLFAPVWALMQLGNLVVVPVAMPSFRSVKALAV